MSAAPATLRAVILADVDAEEARIAVAEDVHRSQLVALAVQAAEIEAEHQRAAVVARAEYAAVPGMPQLPDGQPHRDALHELLRAREALITRQTEAMAAALPQVVQAWDLARPQLDVQAVELAGELSALAEQYGAWHRLLSEARRAAEQPNLVRGRIKGGPSTRMRPRPGPHDVLDAASGQDLCAFGPPDSEMGVQIVSGNLSDGSNRVAVPRW